MGKWEEKIFDDIKEDNLIGLVRNRKQQSSDLKYDYLKMNNITDDGNLDLNSIVKVDASNDEVEKYTLLKGDFLFNTRNSLELVGKTAIFNLKSVKPMLFNNNIMRSRFKKSFDPYFINYQFQSSEFKERLEEIKSGTTSVAAIYYKSLRNIKLKFPPLPVQQRIVAKLDGLFANIDQAIGLLEENIAHTKALMGSVLDEEFGKLDCDSHKLKEISNKIQYGYTGKTKEKGEYYYLRITDIQDGKVDFNKAPFSDVSNEDALKYILNQGDILFARTGATAGKSYLFEDKEPSIFASYLIRVVSKKEILSPKYLKWYFQSDDYWDQIFGNIVGAAQPNFNGKKLGELNIPVPDIQTQNNCVTKFEKYDKVIRSSIETQTQKLNHLKALKRSLLDKAFKGEL